MIMSLKSSLAERRLGEDGTSRCYRRVLCVSLAFVLGVGVVYHHSLLSPVLSRRGHHFGR